MSRLRTVKRRILMMLSMVIWIIIIMFISMVVRLIMQVLFTVLIGDLTPIKNICLFLRTVQCRLIWRLVLSTLRESTQMGWVKP